MLILDTGVIVAAADTSDRAHHACAALLGGESGPFVTTALVIAEAAYLLDRELGVDAEAALYQSVIDGDLVVESLIAQDWVRVRELVTTYANLHLGGTDASVIAVAERLNVTEIATLDHRHFHVVRPSHTPGFVLLP